MEDINSYGVLYPKGFFGGGVHAGIKKKKNDMSIILSEDDCVVSGTFTQNMVVAAPVIVSREVVSKGVAKAIIINSGIANACTNERGLKDSKKTQKLVKEVFNIPEDKVVVASTGVISQYLDMDKIELGIKLLKDQVGNSKDHSEELSQGILTTDTFPKEFARKFIYDGQEIRLGGVCKGSGMIEPNMATLLGFVTTDLGVKKEILDLIVKEGVKRSFNSITVDGDTSTNDMVIVMSGKGSGLEAKDVVEDSELLEVFEDEIHILLKDMAKSIIKDGEGATKFIEVRVEDARSEDDAMIIGKSIANSNLVKTAAFGEDANWGRIIAAAGYSGVEFLEKDVSIYLGSSKGEILVLDQGIGIEFDEDEARKILREKNIYYLINMGVGKGSATIYTCDLSYDYVKINGSYRS